MPKLGDQLFAKGPEWLLGCAKRGFGKAIVSIVRWEPELTDLQVANKLMDWFEPEPLVIQDPTATLLSWTTEPIRAVGGVAGHAYLHEAHVPFTGSAALWRLCCSQSHRFSTRVLAGTKVARLRTLRPDRDVDQFRTDVSLDVERARLAASQQGGAISHFRPLLLAAVEEVFKHHGIDGLRDHADDLNKEIIPLSKR
jgi:hypothetical protein